MSTNLVSNFSGKLVKFLEQKQALGYSYNSAIYDIRRFDRMCAERFPNETMLSEDICNAWATRRGDESAKTTARRLPLIREFARYLISTGEPSYILPTGIIKGRQRYIPHIYSLADISNIWRAFDAIQPTEVYPAAHIVYPALIRLLYCCGLRPSEALNLRIEDVDLRSGKLFIVESKGHKDRIVMLADDMRRFCCNYDEMIREYLPIRRFFFAKTPEDAYGYKRVSFVFSRIRETLQIESRNGNPPRLYDFRHTFATHRLYQWMQDGKDLYAMLPYLSAYMGHSKITETFYYIHLVPGMFEAMSGFKYESMTEIFPEVVDVYE